MASKTSPAPSLDANGNDRAPEAKAWEVPDSDQEFVFENMESAPGWVDRNWAGFDRGPALQLPAGDLYGEGPYHTKVARVGDTVKFFAAQPSAPAHFEVMPGALPEEMRTKRPPQESAAALEDMVKTGVMTVDDLGADAKAQVIGRSPKLKEMIEKGKNAPEAIAPSEYLKLS